MDGNISDELDLPLSSDLSKVYVEHFILDLDCESDMRERVFQGKITLFVRGNYTDQTDLNFNPCKDSESHSVPELTLDSFGICITECSSFELHDEELQRRFPVQESESESDSNYNDNSHSINNNKVFKLSEMQLKTYEQLYLHLKKRKTKQELEFVLTKHSLVIKIPNLSSWEKTLITIHFRTQPDGPSLMWTEDQDGRPCVFTIGDAFNNRSLFPSQDMPGAMASWHCNVSIPKPGNEDLLVLMTGEAEPNVYYDENGAKIFQYFNSYRMPASTFALAIGPWLCHSLNQSDMLKSDIETQCRILTPQSVSSAAINIFTKYIPSCFASIKSVLESYPFQRLDILIAPDCFESLGLACPNLLILSQSLLSSDMSLLHRVAHELCHTWFGILLGPRNWTEDWLTEGMCCYLEDIVHARAMQWSEQETQDRNDLKCLLKYKVLTGELEYIPSSLQILRPDGDLTTDQVCEQSCVKNGIRSETAHVHYMKGFFLLKLLEDTAGQESLLSALKMFIAKFKGELFSSKEILDYFFSYCPRLRSSELSVTSLCQDWLDSPGLPLVLKSFPYSIDRNSLYKQILEEFETLKLQTQSKRKRKRKDEKECLNSTLQEQPDTMQKFLPDQVVLLLGLLLDSPDIRISRQVMRNLKDRYFIDQANAEVQHAWCELVIQQRCAPFYEDVERFLLQHRAMGLYLYGELMISEIASLQAIGHKCYQHNSLSMPRAVRKELREILGLENEANLKAVNTEEDKKER